MGNVVSIRTTTYPGAGKAPCCPNALATGFPVYPGVRYSRWPEVKIHEEQIVCNYIRTYYLWDGPDLPCICRGYTFSIRVNRESNHLFDQLHNKPFMADE